jgi:hypothetical protein
LDSCRLVEKGMHDFDGFICQSVGLGHACRVVSVELRCSDVISKHHTISREHVDDQAAFCLIRLVLESHVTALNGALRPPCIAAPSFEDGLEGLNGVSVDSEE